jgi:ribosomal protein L12E/L44/L45/RPP1/RPP2
MNISKEKQREIAIILQTEQYKGVRVDEDLIKKISEDLEESLKNVEEVIRRSNEPPKCANVGPWIV